MARDMKMKEGALVQTKAGKASPAPTPPDRVAAPRFRKTGPRAVASFLTGLTQQAFAKYGFTSANLITDWAVIVGPEIAAYSQPERLKWPRVADPHGELTDGDSRRQGATLVLRVEGSRAIDLQHRSRQLIERVNSYFGYRAVAELRFVQAPLAGRSVAPRALSPTADSVPREVSPELASINDDGLKLALSRLQSGVRAGQAGRRQQTS
jgi:hypothetical protein